MSIIPIRGHCGIKPFSRILCLLYTYTLIRLWHLKIDFLMSKVQHTIRMIYKRAKYGIFGYTINHPGLSTLYLTWRVAKPTNNRNQYSLPKNVCNIWKHANKSGFMKVALSIRWMSGYHLAATFCASQWRIDNHVIHKLGKDGYNFQPNDCDLALTRQSYRLYGVKFKVLFRFKPKTATILEPYPRYVLCQ